MMMDDDNDGQMIFGDLGGLKLPDICLTGEEKPRKNLTQETCPDRASNPGLLRDRRACYRLAHSGGLVQLHQGFWPDQRSGNSIHPSPISDTVNLPVIKMIPDYRQHLCAWEARWVTLALVCQNTTDKLTVKPSNGLLTTQRCCL